MEESDKNLLIEAYDKIHKSDNKLITLQQLESIYSNLNKQPHLSSILAACESIKILLESLGYTDIVDIFSKIIENQNKK